MSKKWLDFGFAGAGAKIRYNPNYFSFPCLFDSLCHCASKKPNKTQNPIKPPKPTWLGLFKKQVFLHLGQGGHPHGKSGKFR